MRPRWRRIREFNESYAMRSERDTVKLSRNARRRRFAGIGLPADGADVGLGSLAVAVRVRAGGGGLVPGGGGLALVLVAGELLYDFLRPFAPRRRRDRRALFRDHVGAVLQRLGVHQR